MSFIASKTIVGASVAFHDILDLNHRYEYTVTTNVASRKSAGDGIGMDMYKKLILMAKVSQRAWQIPPIFRLASEGGQIPLMMA